MTSSYASLIVGRTVEEVSVGEELNFRLGGDCWITVINPWAFTNGGEVEAAIALKGRMLESIEQDDVAFWFRFADGSVLIVDLSEPVWIGPEAVICQGPGSAISVVN